MILGASVWRSNVTWHVEVEVSPIPPAIFQVLPEGEVPVAFTVEGGRVYFSLTSTEVSVTARLEGEAKLLTFTVGDEGEERRGEVRVPKRQDATFGHGIYVPFCDFTSLTVEAYRMDGSSLEVQHLYETPWWRVDTASITNQVIEGSTYPCWYIELAGPGVDTRYLSSAETNTWVSLKSLPYRVVVSGLTLPTIDQRSSYGFDPKLYEKTLFADFT